MADDNKQQELTKTTTNAFDGYAVLCADFLISKGFSKAVRWFDKRWEQYRVYYKIEGYDCDILLSPCPQVVPNNWNAYGDGIHFMPPEIQVDEFSDIEMLEKHHIGDWHVYVNKVENHLTTLNECSELIELMRVCRCPLIGT